MPATTTAAVAWAMSEKTLILIMAITLMNVRQTECTGFISSMVTTGKSIFSPPVSDTSFPSGGINEVLPKVVKTLDTDTQQCSIVTNEITMVVPNIAPQVCAQGHHLNKARNGCVLCPPGTYTGWINRSQDKKYNDDRNYYNGNTECELCPPGTFYNKKGLTCPNVITDGTYNVDSKAVAAGLDTSKLPCIALTATSMEYTHTPNAGMTKPKSCWTDGGIPYTFPLRWVTQDTGSGHLSVTTGQNTASSSSSSVYLTAKDFVSIAQTTGFADPCITCPAGFRFEEKERLKHNTHLPCEKCPAGKMKLTSERVCSDCPKCTFRSDDVLARSVDAEGKTYANPWPPFCMACPQGRYSSPGSKQCWPCPPGTSTPKGLCDGTEAGSCRYACPAGNMVVKNMVQDASNGTIVLYSCTQCPPGKYSSGNNADTFCTPCKGNAHAPTSGARLCALCAAGKTANDEHTECTGCDVGHYLDGSSIEKNNTCRQCPKGTYAALRESTRCTNCPMGSYNGYMGQPKCTTAGEGTYVDTVRAEAVKKCLAGSVQPYNSDPNRFPTTCTKCAPGRYQQYEARPACKKSLLNEFVPDIPGTEPTRNMSTSSLTLIDGTHGTSRKPISCPMGSWTGPQSTNEIYVLYGKVYKLPMEGRLGVHGIDGNKDTGNGEWFSRRRNFDPAAGFPNRKWSITTRRRGCNSCPVHWYNPSPGANCRDCEPRQISVFGFSVTDDRYSNWMRTRCHNCWTEIILPADRWPLRWITLPWPYHYLTPDDNNDAAQCVVSTKIIIIVILIITSPCLLCMLCALVSFLPRLVMMIVMSIKGAAIVSAKISKKLATSTTKKILRAAWDNFVKGVKFVARYTWYTFVLVSTVIFLLFISLNSGLIWIMDKIAYLVSEQIATWEEAYLIKQKNSMANPLADTKATAIDTFIRGMLLSSPSLASSSLSSSSQPHPKAVKLMKRWGFVGMSRTTITDRSGRDTKDYNSVVGFYLLRLFVNVLLQIIFITLLSVSILFIVVPQMSTSAGWTRTSSVWRPIAWCVLGYEVVVCIILSVLHNRLWDAYDDQAALQIARAKQMMLLAMVWWALLVVLSGATVFGDNFDRGVSNLGDIAVIPTIS